MLLYRSVQGAPEVLLVHPGGPFWSRKNLGAWQIPKGGIDQGEDAETAALREVAEELGCKVEGTMQPLGQVRQAGGKTVIAFAAEQDFDPASLVSTMVEIEWPWRSGRRLVVPEVDEARWFDLASARRHILASQAPFLGRLLELLAGVPHPA